MDLKGKTALISGGGSGIGREIALALGAAGARVAVAGRRADRLAKVVGELEALDTRALAVQADVRQPASIEALVTRVQEELGGIDILVNNAAVFAHGAVVEMSPESWNDVINTNLTGAFLLTRAVLPQMIRRRQGGVVFISSTSGKRADPKAAAYAASKFGLMALAQSLLYEVRRDNIRVIVVSPSLIDTREKKPQQGQVEGVSPHAADVAQTVLHCLQLPQRALIREVEIWGTNPK